MFFIRCDSPTYLPHLVEGPRRESPADPGRGTVLCCCSYLIDLPGHSSLECNKSCCRSSGNAGRDRREADGMTGLEIALHSYVHRPILPGYLIHLTVRPGKREASASAALARSPSLRAIPRTRPCTLVSLLGWGWPSPLCLCPLLQNPNVPLSCADDRRFRRLARGHGIRRAAFVTRLLLASPRQCCGCPFRRPCGREKPPLRRWHVLCLWLDPLSAAATCASFNTSHRLVAEDMSLPAHRHWRRA